MKKIIAIVLMGAMALSLAACGESKKEAETETEAVVAETTAEVTTEAETEKETEITTEAASEEAAEAAETLGGWSIVQDDELPQEAQDALEKALEGLVGATYEPVRLLATQVVAGTNYAILCKVTPVVPDAVGSYNIVYVYADLEGGAEILRVEELGSAEEEAVEGGYAVIGSDETADAAKAALEKALEGLVGADYEFVAALTCQVVAGMNYEVLCKITPVVPDAEGTYQIVTVYQDLEENAEITSTQELVYSIQ